jgi:hypothetical protein
MTILSDSEINYTKRPAKKKITEAGYISAPYFLYFRVFWLEFNV